MCWNPRCAGRGVWIILSDCILAALKLSQRDSAMPRAQGSAQGAHLVWGFGDRTGTDPLEGASWGPLRYWGATAQSMRGEAKKLSSSREETDLVQWTAQYSQISHGFPFLPRCADLFCFGDSATTMGKGEDSVQQKGWIWYCRNVLAKLKMGETWGSHEVLWSLASGEG